ncbi:MAG TPA: Maf family protein [Kiritimatiellia bacterium]|nr:Maf family protein [Kiritimatiellia bacterium]
MHEEPLILASGSPRRRELLMEAGIAHGVVVSGIEERPWPGEAPASYALRLAYEKALDVAMRGEARGRLVLAADTIVVEGGAILEKPVDAEDAVRMLRQLAGGAHEVMTGVCLLRWVGDRVFARGEVAVTKVRFREVSDEEIAAYVATGEPMDKAGAYAIQGGAAEMVEGIEGSYTNVVGLPLETVLRWLGLDPQGLEVHSFSARP